MWITLAPRQGMLYDAEFSEFKHGGWQPLQELALASISVVAIAIGMTICHTIGMTIGHSVAVHAIRCGAVAAHELACGIGGVWQVDRRVAREEAKGLQGEPYMLHWHHWEVLGPHNMRHTCSVETSETMPTDATHPTPDRASKAYVSGRCQAGCPFHAQSAKF